MLSTNNDIDEYFNKTYNGNELIKDNKYNDKNINNQEEEIIGIDLGTTNSCVCIWRNMNVEVIPDEYGNKTVPSVVSFTNISCYIGKSAKNQLELNPDNSFYEIKRLLGKKYSNISKYDKEYLTYKIDRDDNDNIIIKSELTNRKNKYTPEELLAKILMRLKQNAERYLEHSISKVVISVPAHSNDSQREATKDAARIAGLECVRIINEPTAAALAYGLDKKSTNADKDLNVVVCDIGGGTTDISLLNISDGCYEVLGSTGNTHLGGIDFDNRFIGYCMNKFKTRFKIDNLEGLSSISLQRLRRACESAKIKLSTTWKTTVAIKDFYDGKNLCVSITRKQFEKICRDLLILCLKPIEDVLTSSNLEKKDIDEIILVGGMTRMPIIRENIKLFFNGKELNTTVDPDIVVAVGASIQGYMLSHVSDPFSENIVLLDIIPLSLGIETIGGIMAVIIPRNSVIPIRKKKKFTPDADYEKSVKIKVYEGERVMTKDNFMVGEFILEGLKSAPRGIVEIEIIFNIDINGIINISAEDLDNNQNKNSITITGNKGRFSKEKINQLIKEAYEMDLLDKIVREKRQHYYEIDELVTNIKINIDNNEFKLKETDKKMVTNEINNIVEWLEKKKYIDREISEYKDVIKVLREKYGVLILKSLNKLNDIKAMAIDKKKVNATDIYEDINNDTIYDAMENEELGITDDTDNDKKNEIKLCRDNLIESCKIINNIINNSESNLKNDKKELLNDYINDTMLWIYSCEKKSKLEYKQKLNDVDKICNDIVTEDENIFNENTIKNNLEQMCYTIKSSITCNLFSVNEDIIKKLSKKIDDTLAWLIQIDINAKKLELQQAQLALGCKVTAVPLGTCMPAPPEKRNVPRHSACRCDLENKLPENPTESLYQDKINEINNMCNDIYNNMVGINIDNNIDISASIQNGILPNDPSNKVINNSHEDLDGTSLKNLSNVD